MSDPAAPFQLDSGIAVLERTPAVLDAWLRGLPREWLTATEGGETWSAFDVVGHLIDGERLDWIPRTRIVLSGAAERRFEPFDRFHHLTANRGRSCDVLLDEFAALRRANLDTLRGFHLTEADLARTGLHPEFGAVTLSQHLSTWVAHDLAHLAQVARVMARRYREAVGPWRKYLSVLQP